MKKTLIALTMVLVPLTAKADSGIIRRAQLAIDLQIISVRCSAVAGGLSSYYATKSWVALAELYGDHMANIIVRRVEKHSRGLPYPTRSSCEKTLEHHWRKLK